MQQANAYQQQQLQDSLSRTDTTSAGLINDYYNSNLANLTSSMQAQATPWVSPNLGDTSYLGSSYVEPYVPYTPPTDSYMSYVPLDTFSMPSFDSYSPYAEGGMVEFEPMFEGDTAEMQARAKQLARMAYTDPRSMTPEDRKDWNFLAGRYNLPPSSGSQNTYEEQTEESMSALQGGPSARQKTGFYAQGGPVASVQNLYPLFDPETNS